MIIGRNIHTNKFLKYLEILEDKGLKRTNISEATGIRYSKITDVKNGRSSATKEMVEHLLRFYPEVSEGDYSPDFGGFLNDLKRDFKIPLSVVAEKIGITEEKLLNIEAGRSSVSKQLLDELVSAYPELLSNFMRKAGGNKADKELREKYKGIADLDKKYLESFEDYKKRVKQHEFKIEQLEQEMKLKDQQHFKERQELLSLLREALSKKE